MGRQFEGGSSSGSQGGSAKSGPAPMTASFRAVFCPQHISPARQVSLNLSKYSKGSEICHQAWLWRRKVQKSTEYRSLKGRKREGGRSFGKTPLYLLELPYQEKPSVFTINSLYSPSSIVVVHSFVAGTLKERILQPESADDTLHIRNNGRQLGRSECWLWWIMEPISAKCNTKPSQLMSDKQCCQTNVETLS